MHCTAWNKNAEAAEVAVGACTAAFRLVRSSIFRGPRRIQAPKLQLPLPGRKPFRSQRQIADYTRVLLPETMPVRLGPAATTPAMKNPAHKIDNTPPRISHHGR
jgi:hypothetical protein